MLQRLQSFCRHRRRIYVPTRRWRRTAKMGGGRGQLRSVDVPLMARNTWREFCSSERIMSSWKICMQSRRKTMKTASGCGATGTSEGPFTQKESVPTSALTRTLVTLVQSRQPQLQRRHQRRRRCLQLQSLTMNYAARLCRQKAGGGPGCRRQTAPTSSTGSRIDWTLGALGFFNALNFDLLVLKLRIK